jgi:hypothetical protein
MRKLAVENVDDFEADQTLARLRFAFAFMHRQALRSIKSPPGEFPDGL